MALEFLPEHNFETTKRQIYICQKTGILILANNLLREPISETGGNPESMLAGKFSVWPDR